MVGLNEEGACKVWCNPNMALNQLTQSSLPERYFLLDLYRMVETRCNTLARTTHFFT